MKTTPVPFKYYGGKAKMGKWIASLLPFPVKRYCEPFGGAMGVLLNRPEPPFRRTDEIWNDLNGGLANMFGAIRDKESCEELLRKIRFTPRGRIVLEEAFDVHKNGSDDPVLWAWGTYINFCDGYGGKGGSFCTSYGMGRDAVLAKIGRLRDRICNTILECIDWEMFVKKYDSPRTLMYCDPPYVAESRSSLGDYEMDMHSHEAHERFLAWAVRSPSGVAISGYASDLYDEWLSGWNASERFSTAHVSMSKGSRHRIEVLWRNERCLEMFDEEETVR